MIWRLCLIILVVGLFILFALANQETVGGLRLGPGLRVGPIPASLLILGVFTAGMLLSLVITFPGWLRMRIAIKRQRKTIQTLEEELDRLANVLTRSKEP